MQRKKLFVPISEGIHGLVYNQLRDMRKEHPSYRDDELLLFMLCRNLEAPIESFEVRDFLLKKARNFMGLAVGIAHNEDVFLAMMHQAFAYGVMKQREARGELTVKHKTPSWCPNCQSREACFPDCPNVYFAGEKA